ncbi:MAG: hypothetical protein HYW86_01300 [Candidatus Roizmanbacteria bacterium]|nr:MAG: hypothetical protein HYW86_01300 [Candidatus Roizmanbacteria bacterium]
MKKQNNHPTNFWFGFALGTLSTAVAVYLLGTKQGRHKLKKVLEMSENIENISPDLIKSIPEVLNVIVNHDNDDQPTQHNQEKTLQKVHTIENVIDKIKNAAQPSKYVKKFFAKGGKIINP